MILRIIVFCQNTPMQKYKKYHTDIKTCYVLGIQNEILPERFIKEIPGSTSQYWKNENSEKYVGGEFSKSIQNNLDDTKIFLDSRVYFSRKAFIQFIRIYITLITLLGKENIQRIIKSNRNIFVTLIENFSEDFPFAKKDILRFLMISKRQYLFWLSNRKFACKTSLVGQCFKRRPKQISNREISILKKYMNMSKHKTWCIRSIWGMAIRDGEVSMAESTWYKYARQLGYSEVRKPKKKPRKKGSYNAKRPNETWHMDISQYKTLDNVVFYIYTVVHNFSRKIISWDISIYQELKFFIEDYNNNRPCYKYKIYTPNEVHNNPELANFKLVLQNSNQQRLEEHRNFCCKISA